MEPVLQDWYIDFSHKTQSTLTVPIVDAFVNKAIGVINIEHDQPDVLTEETHQRLVKAFADQVALVIKGQELANSMQRRQRQFDSLIATNRILMSATPESFKRTVQSQLESTCKSIEATEAVLVPEAVVVGLEHQSKKELGNTTDGSSKAYREIIVNESFDKGNFSIDEDKFILSDDHSIKVFKQGRFVYIEDVYDKNRKDINLNFLKARGDGVKSAICLPLDTGSKILGVIWFYYKDKVTKKMFEEYQQVLVAYSHRYGSAYNNYLTNIKAKELEEINVKLQEERRQQIQTLDTKFTESYNEVRKQQTSQFWTSLVFGILGAATILYAALFLGTSGNDDLGRIITAIGGALTMGIATLIFNRADKANERADYYHKEPLQFQQLSYLFNLTESIPNL